MRKFGLALVALAMAFIAILIPSAPALAADMFHHAAPGATHAHHLLGTLMAVVAGVPTARLRELQDKREQLVTQARSALDEIGKNSDESRTAELEQRHDTIMGEFDQVDAAIAREERQADLESRFNQRQEQRRPLNNGGEARGADEGGNGMSYRQAFAEYLSCEGQVALMSAEGRSVLRTGLQQVENPSPESRAQTTASGAAGAYTVPVELQAQIIKSMKAFGPMADGELIFELVTSSGYQLPFPTVDDTSKTGAATTQGTTLTDDGSGDAVFGQLALDAFSYATPWIRVSKELADDSLFAMEALLGGLIGERLGRLQNAYLTTGTGTSQPNGILTASSLGITAASTTAFTSDEVISLEHKVDPAYRGAPTCGYMFHDDVLASIRKLKDGQGNYLWQAGNVQQGVPATFNGRRYFINQAMPNTFTTGTKLMIFGDLKKYFVRKVGQPLIGAIQDKDFWPGFGVAGWVRFDGELMDSAAVKHLKLA